MEYDIDICQVSNIFLFHMLCNIVVCTISATKAKFDISKQICLLDTVLQYFASITVSHHHLYRSNFQFPLSPAAATPRQAAADIGRQAVQAGKPISYSRKLRNVVDWMVDRGFASVTDTNKLVVLSGCIETATVLSRPQLVELPVENSSWFSLRKNLKQCGWSEGDAGSASAGNKIFNPKNSVKQYMQLLLTRILHIIGANCFQSVLYTMFSFHRICRF